MDRIGSANPVHIGQLPASAALRFGDSPALIGPDDELSFAEVELRVRRLCAGLRSLGIRPGDRVVLYLANGWRWVVAAYAVARAGAALVPANILLSVDEVSHIVRDSGAVGAIVAAGRHDALDSAGVLAPLEWAITDQACPPTPLSIDSLMTMFDAAVTSDEVATSPDDIALIGYTSGTTGRPKGAVLTHRALLCNVQISASMHCRGPADRVASALPCAHIYGGVILHMAFQAGSAIALFERFDAERILDTIEAKRITIFDGVPTMHYALLASPTLGERDLSSLRFCTVGGQAMPPPRIEESSRRLGCPVIEAWGMTETAGIATSHPYHLPARIGSIGLPVPGIECRIAREDGKGDAEAGAHGELMVRGLTVLREYWGQPEVTRASIDSDGWFATGDIGYRDEDGYLYLVDRRKEMIISAGYNIYPSEIERVLATHPAVALAAVGAMADAQKGEIVIAGIILREGAHCAAEEIEELCRRHLAPYKIPRRIAFTSDLPRTSSGKIMRRELHTLFGNGAASRSGSG